MSTYRNKRRKKSNPWIEVPLAVVITLLLVFNSILIWVATGPRSLNAVTPYIEKALTSPDSAYTVKIADTVLLWDGWRHPIDIRLHGVSVLTKEGATFSQFPEIALGVHVPSLLVGQVLPTSLTIAKPIISLLQNEDRSISFGFKHGSKEEQAQQAATVPFASLIEPLLATDGNSSLRKLRFVAVREASLSIGNTQKGVLLDASQTDIVMEKNKAGVVQISAGSLVKTEGLETPVKANIQLGKEMATVDGSIDFAQIHPASFASLLPTVNLPISASMPLGGQLSFSLDKATGHVTKLGFALDVGKGIIKSERLGGEVLVSSARVEGELSNNAQDLEIKNLTADLDGMPLTASGTIKGLSENTAIDATASLKKVPTEKVKIFWPLGVSPLSREWIVTSITGGIIEEASIKLAIAAGELAKPVLPKESVDANIKIVGTKIQYVPDHPPLEHVDTNIHVDGVALNAEILKASYLKETKLSGGHVLIDDLNADNPYIKASADVAMPASEAVRVLAMPRINQASRLGMVEERTAGTAQGKVDVGFYFFAPKGKNAADSIAYKIDAKLDGVSQPALLGKYELRDITGDLHVDENEVNFKGKGNVNGATLLEAEVRQLSKSEKGFTTIIDVMGGMQASSLARFGVTPPSFMSGLFGFKAVIKQGGDKELYDASLNLTETALNFPKLAWGKQEKQQAKLNLTAMRTGDVTTVSEFQLSGQEMRAKGTMDLKGDDIQRLNATDVQLGKTMLENINYEAVAGGYKLDAKGQSANLSGYMSGNGDFSFQNFPAVDLKLDVAQLIMGEGRELTGVTGEMKCDAKLCSNANLSGKTGSDGKSFQLRIQRNPAGKRQFSLHAQDAGAFLKAFDIIDSMQGGDLSITGNYNDSGAQSVLKGKIDINNYVIKDAPVLAKIISLASFTGMLDTLQGKGIVFKRLLAPFTLHNDVITLTKAKTSGDAIGMTADGTITMPKTVFDISGTVVPSYSLNSAVAKVPLVGGLLSGGDGQGMFAARYSIKGNQKAPAVSVNPLSILTPGFLRGLFDTFDEQAPEDAETDKKS